MQFAVMEAHVLIPQKMYDAFFKDETLKKEEHEDPEEKLKFEEVLETLPMRYKKIGERLLKFIYNRGARWNDKGEVIIENRQPLTGSNIVDLLRDSIHTFKFVPNKARDFYAYCARLHLPQSLIANTTRRDWLLTDIPAVSAEVNIGSWKNLK